MIDNPLLSTSNSLLVLWVLALVGVALFSWVLTAYPRVFAKLRPALFTLIALPVVSVLVLFVIRGFTPVERPLAHWVFDRESAFALRFGMALDPIAWIASISFLAALCGTTLRNRPSVRRVAAAAGAWAGFCAVCSSRTIWTALLGIALQIVSGILPLLPSSETAEGEPHDEKISLADGRWMSATKRNWSAIAFILAGATALASLGSHLDFSADQAWVKLEESFPRDIGAALFLFGLVLLLSPAFSARALHADESANELPANEERVFVFDSAIAWSAVIILYRLQDLIRGTPWPLALSIASAVAAAISLPALVFHERRRNAAVQWMLTLPALAGIIFPLLPAQDAFIFVAGILPIAAGLMVVFESPRTKPGVALSAIFFLGACGLGGWSASSGVARFFSKFEEVPLLYGPVALICLLYAAVGWRIVIRGKSDERETAPVFLWVVCGFLFLLAFGPLISGRWSGGLIPDAPDWIEGARSWPWLEKFSDSVLETNWLGFAVSQSIWFLGVLMGTFVFRTSALFPFAEKKGRGREITSGLFGAFWLRDHFVGGLESFGRLWNEKVSSPLWERLLPGAVGALVRGFARAGVFFEATTDTLTSDIYGNLVRAPAKLVRWIHGGNARLYGWFALIWILIFSLYLTRA